MSHRPLTPGVSVGHWSDREAKTGCTVVLFDHLAWAAVDIRGAAPGTRETELLRHGHLVQRADAILLTGGSAFGLAAADGVVRFLARQNRGYGMPAGPIPIVPAAVLYDLGVGHAIWPDAAAGEAACLAAKPLPEMERGQVGAGTGAMTGKLWGRPHARGGVGYGRESWAAGSVSAVVVVNAVGEVVDPSQAAGDRRRDIPWNDGSAGPGASTTLAVVIVEGPADQAALARCAVAAHDGFARAIRPCHTIFDGDIVFAVATDAEQTALSAADTLRLTVATELAIEAAIADAVTA
jgi:L-aminopeptidase/D-esterase-like protein